MTSIVLLLVVFIPMLVETWRAHANETVQRRRGGVVPPGDVYGAMRIAYPAAFAGMIAEGALRSGPPPGILIAGAALFAVAKALKWWAIVSLGCCWTFRVMVVPGARRVASGPYRYLRHPNYLAVAGELVSVALMAGAVVTGPLAVIAFGWLILKRIRIEDAALDAVSGRR